jgi:hypothetical protein
MSINTNIYGNHALSIDEYYQGITSLQEKLNIRILHPSEANRKMTFDLNEVNYFVDHNYHSKKYDEDKRNYDWGAIYLWSNYELCQLLMVYKHFVHFRIDWINTRTHRWRKFIASKPANEAEVNYFKIWNDTRMYIHQITKKLGGSTLIYSNDQLFGCEQLMWNEVELPEVIDCFTKTSIPFTYSDLQNNFTEFYEQNWFVERW